MPSISKSSLSRPAPRWFRITDGIISDAENVIISILLILGYGTTSPALVIYKMSSEFVRNQLRRFLSNGEEYAPEGTVQTLANVTGSTIETKENIVIPNDNTVKPSKP